MNLIINDHKYPAIKDVDILKHILLELIDIENSPLEVLKVNMNSLFDLIKTFCKDRWQEVKGQEKAKLTKEISKINAQREYWQEIKDKNMFVKMYYNYILKLEKLEPLRGFGFSNSFKDKGKGNAERSRLIYKRS